MALAGVLEIQLVAGIARLQADMDRATRTVGNATNQISRAADAAKAALAGIGAGLGLSQIIQMTDAYAKFTAQLRLASTSAREYAASYADVKRISTAAQQDLQATGMLYARIANGTRELGTTQKQVAAITETVNMALKVSGATAQESASAQLQLSQAFASGTLRGEEFNAVNEAAPRLMLALADGIGVPVGALKKMAEAGEITSKMMADVLPRSLEKLREEAKEVQTIAGAFTVLKNNVMEFVGVQANASGGVAVLTGAIGLLADNLGLLAGTMLTIGAAKLGTWLSSVATQAVANVAANRALVTSNLATAQSQVTAAAAASALAAARVTELRAAVLASEGQVALAITTNGLIPAQARAAAAAATHTAALAAQATALRAASVAGGVMRGALAFLGGPIGAVITLLGIGATAWMMWGDKSKEASDKSTKAVDESTVEMIARLDKQIEKLKERNTLLNAKPELKGVNQADVDGLARAYAELNDARNGTGKYKGESASMRQLAEIDLSQRYNEALSKTATAHQLVTEAANGTRAVQIKEWFGDNGTQAQKMVAELEKLKKKFGEIPPEIEKAVRAKYAATTIKQEATAYQSLITSIGEKIAANKLEMNGYDKLSDAQKMTIKLDEAIASGKNKLTPEHIKEARALIATVAAQDQAIERTNSMAKIQAEYAADIGKSVEAANKEAVAQEDLAGTFGMAKSAIQALEVARMEERLERLRGIDMADDEVAALELVIAAKKRSATALASVETMEANKKAFDQMTEDGKRASEQIGQSLTDNIMQGGKNAADYLRDLFRTLVLRPILSPVGNAIGAAVTGIMGTSGTASAATSGVGSMAGNALGLGASMSAFGGTLAAGFMNTIAGTGFSASLTAGSSLMAGGATASGAGMIVGALAPIALGIAAAVAIWKKLDTSGTYHTGGASSASSAGVSTIRAESLGFEATRTNADTEKMTAGLVTGIVSILDSTALAFGKTAGYTAATAFADDTSKDGAWGALLIGKLGEKIIDWQDTKSGNWAPKVFADGAAGQTQYLAALSASVRTALDGIGLPSWAQTMLDGLGAAPAIEDIAKVVDSINITQRALVVMGERMTGFANLSDDTASALIKASGGIDALANSASAYYDIYYDEGEKAAATTKQVTEALAAVGLAMPATREAFRAQVEAQLALGAAGAPAVAALLGVAGTFAQLNPTLDATAVALDATAAAGRAASDILNERLDLQKQLDQLTMTSVELLAQQRAALDESNRSLFDQVQAAQAAKTASDAAAVAAKDAIDAATQAAKASADALASINQGYQQQIDALVKASLPLAQQRALEVVGMDASTLALYERLEALKGDAAASAANAALMESNQARADAAYSKSVSERQAAESAAAAQAQVLLNQRIGMETTLYNLTHTASEQLARSRGLELASMDATLRPLQSQIFAMQDQASAAAQAATALENAAAAARAIASERGGLQREMFQMQGDTAALRKLELEALDPSNRALKESIFALQDKMAADQAAAQAAAAAAAMAQQIAQAQAQAQAQAAEEQRRAVEEQVRAAEQLKNAWQGITTSIFDEVARIRGLMSGSDTSLSSAQTKFAIATAQARSGDQDAARLLPQLSQAMLQIADATAVTALDLRRIQAQTAASLSQTGMGLTSQYGLSVPSYDVGTDYVPRDMLAMIHEGERITPAAYNKPYTPRGEGSDTTRLEAAVDRLSGAVARQQAALDKIASSTRRSADTLDVVTEGGSAMRTTV